MLFSLFVEKKEESQKLTYLKELGEDGEYKYVAKIDSKTSKLCHSLNGKIFKVKDMIPGVNAPPMHPWCRSVNSGLKMSFFSGLRFVVYLMIFRFYNLLIDIIIQ